MRKRYLLLLTLIPLAVFAQDEEPEFETDRKYECHDRFSDDSTPYLFVESYLVRPEDIADQIEGDVSEEELTDAFEALSKIRFTSVTISGTEFGGMAYQDGLDYRIDFSNNFESDDSADKLEYSLVIEADGDAAFYDFTNIEPGEQTKPDRLMSCNKTE